MKYLTYKEVGEIIVVTLHRPDVLNALNTAVFKEIEDLLDKTIQEQKFKAILFTGSGNKAFVAGADIKEMASMNHLQMLQFCELGQRVLNAIESAPLLIVAAINGYALGGGFELALACDLLFASKNAQLGLPEVTIGLIPGFGGTQRLTRAVGVLAAKQLILTGKKISADEAKNMGLILDVVPQEQLLDKAITTTQEILKNSFIAIIQAKNAINSGLVGMKSGLISERTMCAICFETEERRRAMQAFLK